MKERHIGIGGTSSQRHLEEEEEEMLDAFLEHAKNILGTTMAVPTRISYAAGDLNMTLYIEDLKKFKKNK